MDTYVKHCAIDYAFVIGSDTLSRTLNHDDRSTLIIFGDGAGAVVRSTTPGIISTHLHADGRYSDLLTLPYHNRMDPVDSAYLKISGSEVFKVAVTELAHIVDKTLRLGMGVEKVLININRHGNTSAASVTLAIDESVRDGRIKDRWCFLNLLAAVVPGVQHYYVFRIQEGTHNNDCFCHGISRTGRPDSRDVSRASRGSLNRRSNVC